MTRAGGLLLFDGNSCAARLYYAVSPRLGTKGRFRSVHHGLVGLVLKLIQAEEPSWVAVLLEEPALLKAELRGQFPHIRRLLGVAGIPVIQRAGCPIGQLAAALVSSAEGKGLGTLLVSTRVPLLQLVGPQTILLNPAREQLRLDAERVRDLYGVLPSQIPDWLAFVGDKAEGIPGVPGVGPRTAARLLTQFGSLEQLLDSLDRVPPLLRKRIRLAGHLRVAAQRIRLRLPAVASRLSLESCRFSPPEPEGVTQAFAEVGMTDLLSYLVTHRHPRPVQHQAVLAPEELAMLERRLRATDRFAIDTETTGLDPARSRLVGISFGVERDAAFYLPVGHSCAGAPEQLPLELVRERIGPLLADPDRLKIGQNLKFDFLSLRAAGLPLYGPLFDTMVASYLLRPDRRSHSLDALSLDYLGYRMIPFRDLVGAGKMMADVEIPKVTEYACEDADIAFQLYQVLSKELEQAGLKELFDRCEMPLLLALAEMEGRGVMIDLERAEELLGQARQKMRDLSEEIFALAGRRVALNSPKELRALLRDLGIESSFHTRARKVSVDRRSLQAVADRHPMVERLIRYQDWGRFATEKLAALLKSLDPATRRFHPGYHQAASGTGQIKASRFFHFPENKDLENQLSSLVVAPAGFILLKALYHEARPRLRVHWFGDRDGGQGAQRWLVQTKKESSVSTLLGRSREIPQLNSPNPVLRQAAEKEAMATLIEGSLADLLKMTIVRLFKDLPALSRESRAVFLFQEGLLLEVPVEELASVAVLIRQIMKDALPLRIALDVDLFSGSRLASLDLYEPGR